jgi:hypothetical protein
MLKFKSFVQDDQKERYVGFFEALRRERYARKASDELLPNSKYWKWHRIVYPPHWFVGLVATIIEFSSPVLVVACILLFLRCFRDV